MIKNDVFKKRNKKMPPMFLPMNNNVYSMIILYEFYINYLHNICILRVFKPNLHFRLKQNRFLLNQIINRLYFSYSRS